MSEDHHSSEREEEAPKAEKMDSETKMQHLHEKLSAKKQRFYMLSEEIFDVNQECLSKNDELKILKDKYSKHNKLYVRALTELALKEADLQYKKEHATQKSTVVTDFALESNKDVERLRADLKTALQRYQDSRRAAKGLQEEFNKLADSSRVESLNFLAFCKYSQSVQVNEINKLTVSELLPSKKEINVCTTEFARCAEQSRHELVSFYKQKIHEFQREERVQLGKCKTQLENSHRNKDGHLGFSMITPVDTSPEHNQSSIEHHLTVNSLENRYAQRLLADAQAQLSSNVSGGNSRSDSFVAGNMSEHNKNEIAKITASGVVSGRVSPVLSASLPRQPAPPRSAKKSSATLSKHHTNNNNNNSNSTNSNNNNSSNGVNMNASYLAPTANTTNSAVPKYTSREAERQALSASMPTASSHAQKSRFRAQLSALYRSKKKAASALSEMHAAKHKGVFDASAFRTAAAFPESPLLQNTLLDADLTDKDSNNLVLENGAYVDQGQALGELIGQVCAAEGKFRQLNAIKEGLDVQLVKQAHFLMLVARDLQSDIATKARSSGKHASSLPPVQATTGNNNSVITVNESALSRAFARPDPSAHRTVGTLTAGGAISGKFRYRIDPSCATAAPFVPLSEIQADYEHSEDKIRRIIAEAAAVLKVL